MTDAAMDGPLSAGEIAIDTLRLLRSAWYRALAAFVLLVVPGTLIDSGLLSTQASDALNLLIAILSIVLFYWVLRAQLRELGYRMPQTSRFPAFFVLNLATGLGIVVGLLLLIVPGIVLAVRWSIAAPVLVGSDSRIGESLAASWHATAPHFWSILIVLLPLYALSAVPVFLFLEAAPPSLVGAALLNVALQSGWVLSWFVAIAVHARLTSTNHWQEVFG